MKEKYTYVWIVPSSGIFRRKRKVTAYQEELTLGQEVELVKILYEFDIGTVSDLTKLNLSDVIRRLVESGLIYDMLQIILRPKLNKKELQAIPTLVLGRIIRDFFELNAGLVMLFRSFAEGIASGQKQGVEGNDLQSSD